LIYNMDSINVQNCLMDSVRQTLILEPIIADEGQIVCVRNPSVGESVIPRATPRENLR
jgi:hypothetical protein